ncbi:Splicing factor U2af 38 kDa subunit [Halotydeus destructor]|nr:Splicing factor U2af 38 kDa subunit [Halotydeus destructor]
MAEYLASIFGTEKDKVNCSFYFKIGACRHGDRCSRIHNKPTFSQTILLQNLYQNPQNIGQTPDGTAIPGVNVVSDEECQEHFDNFFEDVFVELEDKYGEIEEMNVCDNLGDHLVGNVYVKFRKEEDADKSVRDLNNRWFATRPIYAELSPVTDFREACCRQYEMGECTRSGFCNFMHLKPISRDLRRELYGRKNGSRDRDRPERPSRRSRSRSQGERRRRSRSPDRKRRSREGGSERRSRRSRSRDNKKSSKGSRDERERGRDRDRSRSPHERRHREKERERESRRAAGGGGDSNNEHVKLEEASPANSSVAPENGQE